MVQTVSISGYRGFSQFEMGNLGYVNLLVGRNNSGKSSVLEGLYLLASGGDPFAIWNLVSRRGERIDTDPVSRNVQDSELDISHLFYGHDLKVGSRFSLATKNKNPSRSLSFVIHEGSTVDHPELFDGAPGDPGPRLLLAINGNPKPLLSSIPLSSKGGLRSESLSRRARQLKGERWLPAVYVSTESLSVENLTRMWDDIVLTEAESRVMTALRFIDPHIEKIASITSTPSYYYNYQRGGFRVKLSTFPSPIPIGSLGDGAWRMLAMAIALIRARDGFLLIDEIDTGLHYTVMEDMWRLIYSTAKEFNIQVFATTHSYDCVRSLAAICEKKDSNNVTIQRIEAGKSKAIPFSEAEIRTAAARNIEVR